jgi:ubiquinone/menaquinone biosynthesis C-methylase UbiE
MSDYTAQYQALPFEAIQIEYRRKLVLREIAKLAPKRLLEIGCGELPLFTDLPPGIDITVVEPAVAFADNAKRLAEGRSGVRVVQGFVEDFEAGDAGFDVVVLSCVLHEVPDPAAMLAAVRRVCGPQTVLHVNVPNARSLHRLLAVAMGLIPDPGAQSETQRTMQQRATTYDEKSLAGELNAAGFEVAEQGSLFVKPFTHAQMQRLVDEGFMTRAMLDGFDKLVTWLPDLGSEIWANARRSS